MLALLLLALTPQQAAPADVVDPADEIVVVSTRKRKCRLEIASRIISDQEFKARAADWAAGKAVRVIVPPGTDYKCLAKIMFKLNDHGVRRADFVEVKGAPVP
jgi:hypothetical protein